MSKDFEATPLINAPLAYDPKATYPAGGYAPHQGYVTPQPYPSVFAQPPPASASRPPAPAAAPSDRRHHGCAVCL